MKLVPTSDAKVSNLPLDNFIKEGVSQSNRVVEEVMSSLFNTLSENCERPADFKLASGAKCWIKKFHPPQKNSDGEWMYGFDVKFEEGEALSHLEFSVKCSGWERVLVAPTTK